MRFYQFGSAFPTITLLFASCAGTITETPAPIGTGPTPIATSMPDPEPTPSPIIPPARVEPPPTKCEMFSKPGILRRSSLVRLIDAGLPRWLQGVEGDRALLNHRFQGWLVKSLHPDDPCYREVDLRRGDIVQKVNGKSIEKPEQAFDVAQSLKTAPAIVVDFLREGKPQKFTIAIGD